MKLNELTYGLYPETKKLGENILMKQEKTKLNEPPSSCLTHIDTDIFKVYVFNN